MYLFTWKAEDWKEKGERERVKDRKREKFSFAGSHVKSP